MPLKADLNRLITKQTESVKPGEFDALTDAELAAKEKAYDAILAARKVSLNDYGRAMEMARVIDARTTRMEGLRVKQARANRAREESILGLLRETHGKPVP